MVSMVSVCVAGVETLPARSLAVTDKVALPVAGSALAGSVTAQVPSAPTTVSRFCAPSVSLIRLLASPRPETASGLPTAAAPSRPSAPTGEIVGAVGGVSSAVSLKSGIVAVLPFTVSVSDRLVAVLSPPAGRAPVVGLSVARLADHLPSAPTGTV